MNDLVKKNILGIGVTDATTDSILEFIVTSVKNKEKPYYVVTPNPEMVVAAAKNKKFRDVLNHAKIASSDGVGLGVAARFLGKPLAGRTTGVDLVEKLCERVADWPITVGFLGAGPKVAEKASECLRQKYPGLRVAFAQEELVSGKKMPAVDVLFVAFGAPKQELWMAEHIGKLPVKVMIGVGGAFDYVSGNIMRAPRLVRSLGLEWLFRLVVQPWRWKRQLALLEFVGMVIMEKVALLFRP